MTTVEEYHSQLRKAFPAAKWDFSTVDTKGTECLFRTHLEYAQPVPTGPIVFCSYVFGISSHQGKTEDSYFVKNHITSFKRMRHSAVIAHAPLRANLELIELGLTTQGGLVQRLESGNANRQKEILSLQLEVYEKQCRPSAWYISDAVNVLYAGRQVLRGPGYSEILAPVARTIVRFNEPSKTYDLSHTQNVVAILKKMHAEFA